MRQTGDQMAFSKIRKLFVIVVFLTIAFYLLWNSTNFYKGNEDYLKYIRFNKNKDGFNLCKFNSTYAFFYALSSEKLYKEYNVRAHILMQSRYDGFIGFPGGNAPNNILTNNLKRELQEEMNLPSQFDVHEKNYIFSHRNPDNGLCMHMYQMKLSKEDLINVIKALPNAPAHGTEILGYVMPPLMYITKSALKLEGFPVFLSNKFVGNSVQQLFDGLVHLNIMTRHEVEKAWTDSLLVRNAMGTDLAHYNE